MFFLNIYAFKKSNFFRKHLENIKILCESSERLSIWFGANFGAQNSTLFRSLAQMHRKYRDGYNLIRKGGMMKLFICT